MVDRMCGAAGFDRWRAQAVDGLSGRVVEVGFGSGLNVPHYPPEVDVVLAVEPAVVARRLADRRIRATHVRIEHVGLDGQEIPLEDASCDGALFTFTLCTVPDPTRALSEVRSGAPPRWRGPLPRARALPRPRSGEMAAAPRTGPAAGRRRMPPHPGCVDAGAGGGVRPGAQRAALRTRAQAVVLDDTRDGHQAIDPDPVRKASRGRSRTGFTLRQQRRCRAVASCARASASVQPPSPSSPRRAAAPPLRLPWSE